MTDIERKLDAISEKLDRVLAMTPKELTLEGIMRAIDRNMREIQKTWPQLGAPENRAVLVTGAGDSREKWTAKLKM